MKNYLLLFLFCVGGWTQAQAQQESNPFSNSEGTNEGAIGQKEEAGVYATGVIPSNPPGGPTNDDPTPVPVDNYIPLLLLTAVGVIIYKTHKKTNISSER